MIKKTYESPYSVISLLTLIVEGKPIRVNFSPVSIFMGSRTGRGSMLVTRDEKIQQAIESHRMFGKTIFLFAEEVEQGSDDDGGTLRSVGSLGQGVENGESLGQGVENGGSQEGKKHIQVSTPAEAREYLVENYGYEAKSLKNPASITKAADEHGIVFEY